MSEHESWSPLGAIVPDQGTVAGASAPADADAASGAPRHERRMRRRRSPGAVAAAVVRNVLLNLAAIAGSICIVLVVLAFVFHVTLIMFRTGSMTPTIPTGSVAVVQRIDAREVRVGDIVTVDRSGQLPVTHRVVSADAHPGGTVTLQLKGDANAEPDPGTYDVTTVRRVVWHAPRLAYVIVWLSQPVVMGGLTLAIAGLVTWVLWPRHEEGEET
jgi:signal peptidase